MDNLNFKSGLAYPNQNNTNQMPNALSIKENLFGAQLPNYANYNN